MFHHWSPATGRRGINSWYPPQGLTRDSNSPIPMYTAITVVGMKHRTLCILSKSSSTELQPQLLLFFETGSCYGVQISLKLLIHLLPSPWVVVDKHVLLPSSKPYSLIICFISHNTFTRGCFLPYYHHVSNTVSCYLLIPSLCSINLVFLNQAAYLPHRILYLSTEIYNPSDEKE